MTYTFAQIESQVKQSLEAHNTQSLTAAQITNSMQLINGDLFLDSIAQYGVAAEIENALNITLSTNNVDVALTIDSVEALIWVTLVVANS